MRGRSHSAEEKAAAVALVGEFGLAEAWRRLAIPKPTLARWCDEAGVARTGAEKTRAAAEATKERHALVREQVRLGLIEHAADLLERMDAPHVEFKGKDADQVTYPIAPAGAVQNYATSVGILIDKYRLEIGEVTGRTESFVGDLDDTEKRQLRESLRRIRQELAAGPAGSAGVGPREPVARTSESGSATES